MFCLPGYPQGREDTEGEEVETPGNLDPAHADALGEGDVERGWVISAYYHPLVSWIWGGALIMSVGGVVSLSDRRIGFSRRGKAINSLPSSGGQQA